MNKKIISIAGVLFALGFVGIFYMMWSNSQSVLRLEINAANSLYRTELPFDITLFDDRVVSGRSLKNIVEETNSSIMSNENQSTDRLKLYQYSDSGNHTLQGTSSIVHTKQYRTKIHHGINGVPDGFTFEEVIK